MAARTSVSFPPSHINALSLMPCHLTSLVGSRTTAASAGRRFPRTFRNGTPNCLASKGFTMARLCRSLADRKLCSLWWSRARSPRLSFLLALTLIMFAQSLATLKASPIASRVSEFTLANGLRVVVVPDHRAPVVTHYVWYLAGSADDPPGTSGIAHFLEHLMFKSTDKIASGEFSKIVSRLGGQDNAFTTHDYTG